MTSIIGKFLSGAGRGASDALQTQAEHKNKLDIQREEIIANWNTKLNEVSKGKPWGVPAIVKEGEKSYFTGPVYNEHTGEMTVQRAEIAGNLTSRLGETPGEQTNREIIEAGGKEDAVLGARLEKEPQLEADKTFAEQTAAHNAQLENNAPKAKSKLQSNLRKIDRLIGSEDDPENPGLVGKILEQANGFTTGAFGSLASAVPGTPAYDLKQNILTLKANIGFDTLQEMRDNSPTGGALGQVAVQELDALQANLSSLNLGQSKEQLIENVERVEQHYRNYRNAVTSYFNDEYGGERSAGESYKNELPPIQGARKAPDGNWYLEKNGQFFRVDM